MELQRFLNLQEGLDGEIIRRCTERNEIPTEDELINKKVLALFVEVGEFANEIKSFKYWKQNKQVDDSKVLEELADIYFFLFSTTNQLDFTAADIENAYLKKYHTNLERQRMGY